MVSRELARSASKILVSSSPRATCASVHSRDMRMHCSAISRRCVPISSGEIELGMRNMMSEVINLDTALPLGTIIELPAKSIDRFPQFHAFALQFHNGGLPHLAFLWRPNRAPPRGLLSRTSLFFWL